MNFKTCLIAAMLLASSVGTQASEIIPPPPPPKPTPTASESSQDESRKMVNSASQDKVSGKKILVPEFPGQPGLSDALIQFDTPLQSNNSKSCS